jgi:hypothetical protein
VEGVSVATENKRQPLTFSRIVRRLPLYFGLALASLTVIALIVALQIHLGIREISGGWFGFMGYTGLLFWVVVRHGRSHWHRPYFWLVAFALLITHCSIFIAILRTYQQFRMIWFWPITVFEAGVIGGTIEWLFPESRRRHRGAEEL